MAQRRMFSPDIVASDAFLDMPTSSRELYFQLGMYADDDGFVNPKKIIRMLGASGDDLKVLLTKRFVLEFESGVVVIKHWLIHNMIRKDRYKTTQYLEEKNTLIIKENGAYSELATNGQPNGNQPAPQVRLGKVRLGKVNKLAPSNDRADPINQVIDIFYNSINPAINYANKSNRDAARWLVDKYGLDVTLRTAEYAVTLHGVLYAPQITTPGQLKEKLAALKGYYEQHKSKQTNKTKVIDLSNI